MTVNGEKKDIREGTVLLDYLESEGYNPAIIAVEHNGEIVPKDKYCEIPLCEDDTLEIVRFVGGG